MSRAQQIICSQCKSAILVGQGSDESGYLYASRADMQLLRSWFISHEGHPLVYGDSEDLQNQHDGAQIVDQLTRVSSLEPKG